MEYLSCTEVAHALRVTSQRVRQLCQAGTLPGIKIGSYWAISSLALIAYRQQPPPRVGRPPKRT